MTVDEKIRQVDTFDDIPVLTNEHFNILKEYSKEDDSFLRSRCAALLVNFVNEDSMNILLLLCDDEDELVRIESYDSLSVFYDERVEEKLINRISVEQSELAYEYALISWADVASHLHETFNEQTKFVHKELEENGDTPSLVLNYYYALTVLGEDHIQDIIGCLQSDDLNIRCSAVNLLRDLMNESNKDIIRKSVKDLSEIETVDSVKSAINRVLGS